MLDGAVILGAFIVKSQAEAVAILACLIQSDSDIALEFHLYQLEEADFRVVAVSTDDSRLLAKAKSFAEGRGWGEDYTLLFDKNQDFMRAMNVSVVPHVFVLDGTGKIVYSHTSYVPGNELELFEAVKKCSK